MRPLLRPFEWAFAVTASLVLAGCGGDDDVVPAAGSAAPAAAACPAEVAAIARCLSGRDAAGAYYVIAMPTTWNGSLVLHAHGGPELGDPTSAERSAEDLVRWAVMVKAGYAWAGSTFRQGGVEVRAAAEDTERLRGIFRTHVAVPRRTILHGQSWGANVAAKAAETYTAAAGGPPPYDAVLLTSGVLAGGTHSYDFRLDLRALYQHLCHNHPRPTEPAYPLNIGLPKDSTMTQSDLQARTAECLGLDKPAAQRTADQQQKVQTIVDVIRIPASSIQSHLNWGTFHFKDIVHRRTGGASPFGNVGAVHSGSADDAALNAAMPRFAADPVAYRRFAEDTDLAGRIPVPVLTVKAVNDPTAFVELDAHFKATMEAGGSGDRLVQTFADFSAHSYLSDPTYAALLDQLMGWVDRGEKPTPASVGARCATLEAAFGAGCRFLPDHIPAALATRVPERTRP